MSEYDNPTQCLDCKAIVWRHYLDFKPKRCPACWLKEFIKQETEDMLEAMKRVDR